MADRVRFEEQHSAVCKHCGFVCEASDSGKFMYRTFMPSICKACGEYPEWIHRVEKLRWTKAPGNLLKPWTWLYFWHPEVVDTRDLMMRW